MTDSAKDQLLRSAKVVAALATHRKITPMHVRYVEDDREIRAVLDRIVRRWSNLVPVAYTTDATAAAWVSHSRHKMTLFSAFSGRYRRG